MALRCFIAVSIPEDIKKTIGGIIDALRRTGADVKWVGSGNIHITLKFLGTTEETLVGPIKDALLKKVSPHAPFYIKIGGVGFFPDEKRPRVIWLGIEDSGLGDLQKDIDKEMAKLGYPAEDRPFSPHLTIGRVRSTRGITGLIRKLEEYRTVSIGETEVREIILMKSELKPAGAEYSSLAEIPLGGRNHDE